MKASHTSIAVDLSGAPKRPIDEDQNIRYTTSYTCEKAPANPSCVVLLNLLCPRNTQQQLLHVTPTQQSCNTSKSSPWVPCSTARQKALQLDGSARQ
jgi:hypothetical protein